MGVMAGGGLLIYWRTASETILDTTILHLD